MSVGSQRGLYFFMPQTFFNQQRIFSHADKQGSMGMSECMNLDTVYSCQSGKFF